MFLVLTACLIGTVNAQGIRFVDGTYTEALKLAKEQNRLLFIDLSMDHCGPCKLMETRVFPLPEVGEVYNDKFVCWKTNTSQSLAGKKIAEENGIRNFPSFLWVDPQTGKAVHQSSGARRPEDFIKLAEKPFVKDETSAFLQSEYAKGNRDFKFLSKLYAYYSSERKIDKMKELEKDLVERYGEDFKHEGLANFYFDNIFLRNSIMTKYMLKHQKKVMKVYGKERVMNKIAGLQ